VTLATGAITLALALVAAQGPRAAAKRKKVGHPPPVAAVERRVPAPARAPAPTPRRSSDATAAATADGAGVDAADAAAATPAPAKTAKTKVYTFGAMDVEGKLKTPQLLYFLNRIKLELEMSAPDHRSFMKELERTADDPNL
jgi:hypothetical protein